MCARSRIYLSVQNDKHDAADDDAEYDDDDDDDDCDKGDRKLSYRKQAVQLLHNIEIAEFSVKKLETYRSIIWCSYRLFTDDYFVLSQFTHLTDGRTDGQTDVDSKTVHYISYYAFAVTRY